MGGTGSGPQTDVARNDDFEARYRAGETLEQIGQRYGVTRERVRQILAKKGMTRADGGQAKSALLRKQTARAALERRYQEATGLTFTELSKLRAVGREMMASGIARERTPIGAFIRQRENARKRGIGWELSFSQWWKIWQDSGLWKKRGRTKGCYVMCRKGDTGPYAEGNVFIATCTDNLAEGFARYLAKRRAAPTHEQRAA